jgi:glutamate racemase
VITKSKSPIGVFDSGLGGLTVLTELEKILPNESFIYYGDTAHVPYGSKSVNTIIRYSRNIIEFFMIHNAKAVVIACNTASAVAFPEIRSCYDTPLFDVVMPSVVHSNTISKTRKIGVIGTHSTIFSRAYTQSFTNLKSDCSVIEISCPLFVPLIEEGWTNTPVAKQVAHSYLKPFKKTEIDTLILGCTHYPIMAKTIQEAVESHVQLVFSGKTVGDILVSYLEKNRFKNDSELPGKTKFYVSDLPQKFDELGSRFLKRKIEHVEHIPLW